MRKEEAVYKGSFAIPLMEILGKIPTNILVDEILDRIVLMSYGEGEMDEETYESRQEIIQLFSDEEIEEEYMFRNMSEDDLEALKSMDNVNVITE